MPTTILWHFQNLRRILVLISLVSALLLGYDRALANLSGKDKAYFYFLLSALEEDPKKAENYLKKAIKADKKSLYLKKSLVLLYFQTKRLKEAETLAEELYASHPQDQELGLILAKIYFINHRPYKAANILEQVLERDPKNEGVLGFLLNIYLEKKDWNQALRVLDKLTEIDEKNYTAWLFKARILKEQNKIEEAKECYVKALQYSSDNKMILSEVLKFLDEIQDFKTIETLLKTYILKYPEDEDYVKFLASFYVEKEDWGKIEKLLKNLPDKIKHRPEILFFLGLSLERQKKLDEALKIYEEIVSDDDWQIEASKRIVLILRKKNKNEAIEYFKKLEAREKKTKNWFLFLLQSAEALDLCEKGISYGKEALRLFPEDLELTLAVASNYACLNEYNKVLELVLPWLKKYPEDPYVLNFVGYSYVELGTNLDEAESMLYKALQKKPTDPYILDSIGWCYYKKGNLEAAYQYLERAVKNLKEDEPEIYEHLGDILMMKQKRDEACQYYKEALNSAFKQSLYHRLKEKLKKHCEDL